MEWRDTREKYGLVSRILHWVMAGLLLWQFTGMAARVAFGRAPLVSLFVGTHAPLGALLFVLIVARLLWGLANRERRPAYEPGLLGLLAKAGHLALYALMFIVPALALMRAYGSGRGFQPFGIPLFPATGEQIAWLMAPANALHGVLAWVLLSLIAGHVGMVLVHRFVWRDDVASRMIPGRGARVRAAASAAG
ncbi:cytochrome b561 [Pseudochelatococcus lubricantis]|uniref:Cytochrome b561 n=1 Tax=Pseudochelatococcus lubricantis TaxID=1538102 RepID=A0ABX0V2E4_9HYPH|nr:cytochrome b [Pseudochelatococcus lubricantis]NIJ58505.1 cytochrome b561 [Pseudochelatococcus lubricantis]